LGTKAGPHGQLIALDGARGPDLATAAKRLVRSVAPRGAEAGVSAWDASGIFWELRKGDKSGPHPSPRTLLLLYACDLAFRLRWEIRPAIEEGMTVIAAPYVETAVALGRATGVPRRWLVELFSFAPKAESSYRLKEKKNSGEWRGKRSEGFLEFCCKTLIKLSPAWNATQIRERFLDHLESLEDRGDCRTVTEKLLERLETG
jgi:thymidylate kinase